MKTQVRNYEYEFATLIYLILVIPFLSNLPVSESVYFWYEAESWNKVFNNSWHPPLYLIILRLFKLFTNNATIFLLVNYPMALRFQIYLLIYKQLKES